jgi:hypothetical protein
MFNVTTAYSDKSVVTVTHCEISLMMLNTGKLFSFNSGILVIFCCRKHFQMHKKYTSLAVQPPPT